MSDDHERLRAIAEKILAKHGGNADASVEEFKEAVRQDDALLLCLVDEFPELDSNSTHDQLKDAVTRLVS